MHTGDLVVSRFVPGQTSTGSITANKLVLEYDSGLAQPSAITTTVSTSDNGATVFSSNVQVGEAGVAQMTTGILAFTGLAVQSAGMPASFSTLDRPHDECTKINPCTLTLAGRGPGVYSVDVSLPNQGNTVPEVSKSHQQVDARHKILTVPFRLRSCLSLFNDRST